MAVQVDTISRPGEVLRLLAEDVALASESKSSASLVIRPSSRDEKCKTGLQDDAVVCDDVDFPTTKIVEIQARGQTARPEAI